MGIHGMNFENMPDLKFHHTDNVLLGLQRRQD
jgi:Mg2+ and Co2+ transporter CorA